MKTKSIITLCVIFAFSLLSGCSSIKVSSYTPDLNNIQQLKNINIKFNVAEFTAKQNQHKSQCRLAAKVSTPKEEPFQKYIENALIIELKASELYSPTSPITIHGHLNDIDDSSSIGDTAYWSFNLSISNNQGESFLVNHKREYSSSFMGAIACGTDMPQAFMPTVQELISEIINNPEFSRLFVTQ